MENTRASKTEAWLNVCLKNVVIFLSFLEGNGLNPEPLWTAIRLAISESVDWLGSRYEHLSSTWVSLYDYQVLENTLVDIMGHPAWLTIAGRYSRKKSFESKALQFFLKYFIRFITSPRVGVWQIAKATSGFNHNKTFTFVVDEWNHCILRMEYLTGPNGEQYTVADDIRSVLNYIRGLMEAVPTIWAWQDEDDEAIKPFINVTAEQITDRDLLKTVGKVRYLTINVTAEQILAKELPSATVEYRDSVLYIDGEKYGYVVYLSRDPKTDQFHGDWDYNPTPGSIPAIYIERELSTQCKKTGHWLPLIRPGEILRYNKEIPTLIFMAWYSNLFLRLGDWVMKKLQPIEKGLQSEARAALAEMRERFERRERLKYQESVERKMPTKAIAQALVNGTFQPFEAETLVMNFDVAGSRVIAKRHRVSRREATAMVRKLVNEIIKFLKGNGFWIYKSEGDGCIVVYSEWDRLPDEPKPHENMHEAALTMINCALEMHNIAKRHGLEIRVGITASSLEWHNQTNDEESDDREITLEGGGQALDECESYQRIATRKESGVTAVGPQVVQYVLGSSSYEDTLTSPVIGPFRNEGKFEHKFGEFIEAWHVLRPVTPFEGDTETPDNVVRLRPAS